MSLIVLAGRSSSGHLEAGVYRHHPCREVGVRHHLEARRRHAFLQLFLSEERNHGKGGVRGGGYSRFCMP